MLQQEPDNVCLNCLDMKKRDSGPLCISESPKDSKSLHAIAMKKMSFNKQVQKSEVQAAAEVPNVVRCPINPEGGS